MFNCRPLLKKAFLRWILETASDLKPGMPGYMANAKSFMPLEITLGHEVETHDLVEWRPAEHGNGFFMIVGASGSGKTEALKTIGHGIVQHAIPVLVLDFHGDVKFPGQDSYLMSSGVDSWMGINPMALDGLDGHRVGLYDLRMALVEMIRRAVPTLSAQQRMVLSQAIEAAYSKAGISDQGGAGHWGAAPTFANVLSVLREWARDKARKSEWPRFQGCITAIEAVFGHPLFRRQRNITVEHILQRNVRLDLSALSEGAQFLAAETVLRMVFNALRLRFQEAGPADDDADNFRLFIVIDEAKIMCLRKDPDDPDCILNRLFTEARKFGIGLIVASQRRDHFGADIRANAEKKLVLSTPDLSEARRNSDIVQVAPEELMRLKGKGEGYLRDGHGGSARKIQIWPQRQPSTEDI